MANIQCEQCHGPAGDHVKNGSAIMATSQDEGVCNVCHNGSSRHDKGEQLKNAGHSDKEAAAFNDPGWPWRAGLRALPLGQWLRLVPGRPDEPGGLGQQQADHRLRHLPRPALATRTRSNCASSASRSHCRSRSRRTSDSPRPASSATTAASVPTTLWPASRPAIRTIAASPNC